MLFYWKYLIFVAYFTNSHALPESGYIMTSPAVFRAGVDHSVNVRLFNHNEVVRVYIKLVDLRENLLASASEEITNAGLLTIHVPPGKSGKANLRICGNCHTNNNFRFSNSTPVTILKKGSSAFLQTDKPIYKPSQTVNVNVITVNRDLKPVNKNVTAYVVAPNNVRMFQWSNLKESCCGVRSFSFQLSDQPVLGEWKIFADIERYSYNTTFEIREYVRPKFDVVITAPPYFRSNCEDVVVKSNYLFDKPVVGNLSINFTIHGVGYSKVKYLERGPTVTNKLKINGTTTIPICQSDLLPPNLNPYFKGALSIFATVSSDDGNSFTAFDNTTPISKHLVSIEFGKDTRQHFKPGIPFRGKVIARYLDGTRAPYITIMLNVEVDRTSYYRQEITSDIDGVIKFQVPELPSDTKLVWIEARVFAIQGELIGAHYQSIYRNLHKWNSQSNCYLLAQGPDTALTSGTSSKVVVKSNCPCNFTLYYEMVSRGNIVQTGNKIVTPKNSVLVSPTRRSHRGTDAEICQTSLTINVTSSMAPVVRMLVYFVKENGEGVADSIHLPVTSQLDNDVNIESSSTDSKPGSEVNIEVSSNTGSCVCLTIVDKSVHLMKPDYMIKPNQIFDELYSYDLDNLPFEQQIDWWKLSRTRRSTNLWWNMQARDSKFAFLEAGLVVMSNYVSLDNKITTLFFPSMSTQAMQQLIRGQDQPQGGTEDQNSIIKRRRTYFPETWFWKCFNVSSGLKNLTLTLPDSITSWRADAFTLNSNQGIGISKPHFITSFKPFFVDFKLPYSVIRGELVTVPVTTYNYLDSCVKVSLSVLLPFGINFKHTKHHRMVSNFCISSHTTKTISVDLKFGHLGTRNISAMAHIVPGTCCGHKVATVKQESDFITKSVIVKPEGVKRDYTYSVYFCPNERINITTPTSFAFQFVKLPGNITGFSFLSKASRNVHLVLASEDHLTSNSFKIILGGSNNQQSWISRDSQHLVTASTLDILSEDQFRSFWVVWEHGNIQVGTGSSPGQSTRFMQWQESGYHDNVPVRYIGFATGDGVKGEFLLWRKEESGSSFNEVFVLELPANTVKGSTKAVASVIGDVMGPTLKNLNNLLSLPYGCGEQNMIKFAPNIYVLNYLKATQQLTYEIEQQATQFLVTGYQRQLTYKRFDGSYSPFGDKDFAGSMWLTSFVLKSFSQARDLIFIDPNEIHEIKEWIFSRQRENGAFPAVGKVWNKDTQTGNDSEVALTAYVIIAMLKAGLDSEKEEIAMFQAKEFLELHVFKISDSYTSAIVAYSLTLLESEYAVEAKRRLMQKAKTDRGAMYWTLQEDITSADDLFGFGDSMKQTVISAEIEMTSYALLMFTHHQNNSAALPIVKWLSKNRNALGGFSSTQDTCVALNALSEYAIFSFIGGVNLNVSLATTNYATNFQLNNENSEVLQTTNIPSLPTTMFVDSTGYGCALLQINVDYNIPTPDEESDFYIKVQNRRLNNNLHLNQPDNTTRTRYEVGVCVRWLHSGSSNMAVLEFNLLTGLKPDLESLQKLIERESNNLMRYEIQGRSILFYFDEVHSTCNTCVKFKTIQEFATENVQPQSVKVFDYYEPGYTREVSYLPNPSLACEVNDTDCTIAQEQQDCGSLGCTDDDFTECRCEHNCGFGGPAVCGSNGEVYINQCRLDAASCELNMEIEPHDFIFCEEAEVENELPLILDIPVETEKQEEDYYADYKHYLSDDSQAHFH